MEYETDGEHINLGDDDSAAEQDDDWEVEIFERAIDTAFSGNTQVNDSTCENLFPSDCDEIF
jgi:hypothetical protein